MFDLFVNPYTYVRDSFLDFEVVKRYDIFDKITYLFYLYWLGRLQFDLNTLITFPLASIF